MQERKSSTAREWVQPVPTMIRTEKAQRTTKGLWGSLSGADCLQGGPDEGLADDGDAVARCKVGLQYRAPDHIRTHPRAIATPMRWSQG